VAEFVGNVAVIFEAGGTGEKAFDVWENTLVVIADSPAAALEAALSTSRRVLDDASNWRALGYLEKPMLYAIKSLHSHVDLPSIAASGNQSCFLLNLVATFDAEQIERLVSYRDVEVPYVVMHIDDGGSATRGM
jgi:hypothetical protein